MSARKSRKEAAEASNKPPAAPDAEPIVSPTLAVVDMGFIAQVQRMLLDEIIRLRKLVERYEAGRMRTAADIEELCRLAGVRSRKAVRAKKGKRKDA